MLLEVLQQVGWKDLGRLDLAARLGLIVGFAFVSLLVLLGSSGLSLSLIS